MSLRGFNSKGGESTGDREVGESPYPLIETEGELAELIEKLLPEPRYAVDTEFHRERTYYPDLALVQIAWSDGLVLIDPLKVDIAPLAEVLEGDGVAVMHASSQDLEVMLRATGTVPARLFDTQIAAGFIGLRSPSLAALHDQFLGMRLEKGDRLTDWLARPLEPRQLSYAAGDVLHLLEIDAEIRRRLVEENRLVWAEDECELARQKGVTIREPSEAWRRIKEARSLRGSAQKVIRHLAAWREELASKQNRPPRYVVSDLALVSMAQRPPKNSEGFKRIRGFDERQLKVAERERVLEVIREGLNSTLPAPPRNDARDDIRDLRPAVTLIGAWLAQYARDHDLDPALVGSRSDIEELLRGSPDPRLGSGWRKRLVGEPIRRLVAGEVALAFEGDGRISLEERSFTPVSPPPE